MRSLSYNLTVKLDRGVEIIVIAHRVLSASRKVCRVGKVVDVKTVVFYMTRVRNNICSSTPAVQCYRYRYSGLRITIPFSFVFTENLEPCVRRMSRKSCTLYTSCFFRNEVKCNKCQVKFADIGHIFNKQGAYAFFDSGTESYMYLPSLPAAVTVPTLWYCIGGAVNACV